MFRNQHEPIQQGKCRVSRSNCPCSRNSTGSMLSSKPLVVNSVAVIFDLAISATLLTFLLFESSKIELDSRVL